MRKRAGSDPAHGNWEFVEYTRQGADDRFAVAARDGVCWSCHGDVRDGSDWVFTLLE
jgi:DNA-binding transcriptional regulator PaaX